MGQSKNERMKELVSLLNKASRAYYQEAQEIMSNYEYDRLYDELKELEDELGITLSNSPTVNVGYEVVSELPKERHESPMLSLDKTKEVEELKNFVGDQKVLISWKMDGLTVVLTYRDGKLYKAVTRGNGEVGEVITNNAKVFKNVPVQIAYQGELILRGEAVIGYKDFEKINQEIEDTKKSVSDGKTEVASAITEKGVATESTDSFAVMAENVRQIKTGGSTGGSGSVITRVGDSIKTHTSNQIGAITHVGEAIKTKVTSRKLEEKFAAVHSDGNSWVDTGINGKSTIKIQLKFKMQKATGAIFVGMMLSGDQALRFFGYGNNWYMDYGGDGHRIIGGLIDTTKTYEFELGNNYIKDIESGSYIAKGNEVGTFEYGFGDSHIKVLTSGEIGDIYYCKIYDGDTLVRDFIPKYDAEGKPKLYDNVSNTYFENKGTEEFTAVKELS